MTICNGLPKNHILPGKGVNDTSRLGNSREYSAECNIRSNRSSSHIKWIGLASLIKDEIWRHLRPHYHSRTTEPSALICAKLFRPPVQDTEIVRFLILQSVLCIHMILH